MELIGVLAIIAWFVIGFATTNYGFKQIARKKKITHSEMWRREWLKGILVSLFGLANTFVYFTFIHREVKSSS